MNGLRITFGGAFKILDNYDEKVLRINLKVKNISNCTNCLKTWTLKSFDAKGVELDYSLGSFFGDSRSIDNDVNLLPGSTASQNYYIEYKVPYVTLTVAIESEDSEKVDYVQLFLVEKDSVFNSVLKEQRQ